MPGISPDQLNQLYAKADEAGIPRNEILSGLKARGITLDSTAVAPDTTQVQPDTTSAPPDTAQGPAAAMAAQRRPSMLQGLGQTLMQGARDVNSMLPAIGGTVGAALTSETGPGMIGGGMLGAAGGRALEQTLAPLLGQQGEVPNSPQQAYGNVANSALGGAVPGALESAAAKFGPMAARKLAEASIRHGYGDPSVLAKTMLDYGIQNSRAGVSRIVNIVKSLSNLHNQGIDEMSRGSQPLWGAIQDYMTPALAPIRRALLNTNLPAGEKAALRSAVNEFVQEHGIRVPPSVTTFGSPGKAAAQNVVRAGTDQLLGMADNPNVPITAEHASFLNPPAYGQNVQPGGIRDRTIGIKQLNALKEDADNKLRFLRETIAKRSTEATPTPDEATRMRVYEALGDQARNLMYGPKSPETGLRMGGPAEHLQHLDQEQSRLLTLKTNIGPDARLRVGRARTIAERAAATLPVAGAAGLLVPGPAATHALAAVGGGLAGAAMSGPSQLSGMALTLANPALAHSIGPALRATQAATDVAMSRRKK